MLSGAAVVVALSLAGCSSVIFEDPVYPEATDPAATRTPGIIPDPLPSGAAFDRGAIAAASNEILDCSSGSVVLDYAGSFAIKGDCASVTLTGDATVLTADHIGALQVKGYGHIVLVASVDDIALDDTVGGTVVQWEQGDPKVDDKSADSRLFRAR